MHTDLKNLKSLFSLIVLFIFSSSSLFAQKEIRVLPKETDSILNNPGIGFTTFQRFNGDTLNRGMDWTEGFPIVYQKFDGNIQNKDYPSTTIAYFRIYWRYMEPEEGKYNWQLIDDALKTAHNRGQTLMLRVAPYGEGASKTNDVPGWYRKRVGEKNEWLPTGSGWRVDAEDPKYAQYFGQFISELGKRYDGNPGLEAVDLSIVGFWGEGRGARILKQETREKLVDAYTDNFRKTPLMILLTDKKTVEYALSKANVGWRMDCLGDMGGFSADWAHMIDEYPQDIINFGMVDAWKKGPVSLEVCWVMQKWKEEGWDVDYIIDQSLKWHISTFNAKSSAVPQEWWPQVNRWLKRMGYRFVLRKFTFPEYISEDRKLSFTSWWENKGVAPIYKTNFSLALRLTNKTDTLIRTTKAPLNEWLPGDNLYNDVLFVPYDFPAGTYTIQVGIVDNQTLEPGIKLAIEGRTEDGWYNLGEIIVK